MSFSKQPKTEKSQGSTWSVGDFDQCVSLIVKAKQRPGAFEDVMRRVDQMPSPVVLLMEITPCVMKFHAWFPTAARVV